MNQNGVATILAIGITALLLCLGIAYVTTSIVEKKAATNYQSMITARIAAQTAFNRAVAKMKDQSIDTQESYNEIVSHDPGVNSLTSTSPDSVRYFQNLPAALTTSLEGHSVYSLDTSYPQGITFSDTSTVTWVYFVDTSTTGDTGVVSRIAYVVIPDKGKIDPWAVIDSGVNSGTPPSEVNYGNGISSIAPDGSSVIGRPGRDITELALASLETDTNFSSTYTQKMSVTTASPSGSVAVGPSGNWTEFEDLFTVLNIPASQASQRDYFRKVFYINSFAEPEEFWIDSNADSIRNLNELTGRFDLTKSAADFWNSVDTGSIANSIPWLGNWKAAGDFPSADSARNQIVANLITYCKADTNAVTDSPNAPSYVGLERCPYINEARIQVPITITRLVPSPATGSYSWTIVINNPKISVETVDMYGVTLSGSALPRAIINLNLSYYLGQSGSESPMSTVTITDSSLDVGYANKGYASTEGATLISGYPSTFNFSIPTANSLSVKIYLNSFTIRLESRDATPNMYDFAYLKTTNSPASQFSYYLGNAGSGYPTSYYIDYQVRDPRQNLLTTDWVQTSGTLSTTGTLGAPNSIYPTTFTGSDTDPEPNNTAPWNISTAYIRKGPMKSPWEIGFIHRAKAFQTLNLKKYNADPSFGYGFGPKAGGDAYSAGDANILDQIKMTANTATKGKINVNSDNQSVLRTLFDNIKLGSNLKLNSDPGVIGSTGTATITPAVANTIADSIRAANGTSGGTQFYTRASIVNAVSYLSTTDPGLGYSRTTDAQQEELIGKFINLTKAESPHNYTVIVVGEAIRDIGGVTIRKDLNNDGNISAGESISTTKGKFDPNADEILATQKILAIIQEDPATKKFIMLRMMYLSD